ncbi:pentapeptide repeat-containing protein [Pseudanabaena sp. FACHB-1998]|uniref:pentapeptide repeat-containing protein n=1 Tax=Pseudanabaena sp. FACHB-1998 TaxID=2692858 RepID=UPI0016803817|nr:pentapeptide repeat-containing protein [Pseudanabaena sp. FACHB-1998]MBD2175574.1 pentapeptide repeat-containing protein [Pseudanabaena sp. FACHB-1998]
MSQGLNFANQDLRDRSFQGKNLIGADFSGADLRGCNFCRSQLKSANFANVLTGRSPRQTILAGMTSFVMAFLFAGTAMIASILLITFSLAFIFGSQIINLDTVYWVAIIVIVVFAVGFATTFTGSFEIVGVRGIFAAIPISLITAFASGFFGSTFAKLLVSGAFKAIANSLKANSWTALLTFLAIEPLQIFGSLYLFRLTINMARANIGTKFQYADLTKASFHQATLVSCDFSNAVMNDVNWEQAQIIKCKL